MKTFHLKPHICLVSPGCCSCSAVSFQLHSITMFGAASSHCPGICLKSFHLLKTSLVLSFSVHLEDGVFSLCSVLSAQLTEVHYLQTYISCRANKGNDRACIQNTVTKEHENKERGINPHVTVAVQKKSKLRNATFSGSNYVTLEGAGANRIGSECSCAPEITARSTTESETGRVDLVQAVTWKFHCTPPLHRTNQS